MRRHLVPGDHGTTYGGNPLACAAATKVFELFEKQHVLDNVKEVSAYFEEKLDELVETYGCCCRETRNGTYAGT